MPKTQIRSDRLRQPSGVFSHATMIEATGRLVFISGMTARRLDGTMEGVGDIEAQTRQVCENLKAAVEAAGGTMDDVTMNHIFLKDWADYAALNKVYAEYFPGDKPARFCIVCSLVRPDFLVEIASIAHIGKR